MAHGHDIPDSEVFFELLSKNSKIKMFFVVEEDITKMSKYLPTTPLKTVEGTRGIHQVITSRRHENRKLSCFCKKMTGNGVKLVPATFQASHYLLTTLYK